MDAFYLKCSYLTEATTRFAHTSQTVTDLFRTIPNVKRVVLAIPNIERDRVSSGVNLGAPKSAAAPRPLSCRSRSTHLPMSNGLRQARQEISTVARKASQERFFPIN